MTAYRCLLCGVDHPIVDGRVEHTVFHAVGRTTVCCPACGHTMQLDVSRLSPRYEVPCQAPYCGRVFRLDEAGDFRHFNAVRTYPDQEPLA